MHVAVRCAARGSGNGEALHFKGPEMECCSWHIPCYLAEADERFLGLTCVKVSSPNEILRGKK